MASCISVTELATNSMPDMVVTPARPYTRMRSAISAGQVALLEPAGLLAERRALERLKVLEQLAGVEVADRFVVGAADRHRELRRDVDLRAVPPGPRRRPVHVGHAAHDLLGGEHRGHPPLAVLPGAAPHLGMVAAGVDGHRVLRRFGEALHLLEADRVAPEGGLPFGKEEAERLHALVDDGAATDALGVGE